jgi:glycerol-3-phosphate acyltransferase PlsY
MTALACAIAGYLAGSIPFAIIVSKLMSLPDPRTYGSKNIGATNVLRSGNRIAAIATLAGDLAKGWVAVMVARYLQLSHEMVALVGFAAFVGHVFPVWLKFNGGKGVATYIGVLIGLFWPAAVVFCLIWLAIAVTSRYSSLAALVAAFATPLFLWWFGHPALASLFVVLTLLLFWKHSENIKRLQAGTEGRIGAK